MWSAGGTAWSSKVGLKCRSASSGTVLQGGRTDDDDDDDEFGIKTTRIASFLGSVLL